MMTTNKKKKEEEEKEEEDEEEEKNTWRRRRRKKNKDKMTRHSMRVDVRFLSLPTKMSFSKKKTKNDSNSKEQ